VGTFATLGGILAGLDISSMSGVLQNPYYTEIFGVKDQGQIVACMPAGSFFGALAVGQLADRIGRKKTVMLVGIVWTIGAILQAAAVVRPAASVQHYSLSNRTFQNKAMLIVGRIIGGFSVGIATTIIPLYQAEVTVPSLRGRMISVYEW
jgi:MFS family permease